jgi:hypothetical protein
MTEGIKFDDLTGADLDYWVGRAEGHDCEIVELPGWRYCRIDVYGRGWTVYAPSQDGSLAGRILRDRFYTVGPALIAEQKALARADRVWMAEAQMNPIFHDLFIADSPWIAICRLRVAEALSQHDLMRNQFEQWRKSGRTT